VTLAERKDRLAEELRQQLHRQAEIERALHATQAQVLRLQGALALVEDLLANGAGPEPVREGV